MEPSEIMIRQSMFWYIDLANMFKAIRFADNDVKDKVIKVVRTARIMPIGILVIPGQIISWECLSKD